MLGFYKRARPKRAFIFTAALLLLVVFIHCLYIWKLGTLAPSLSQAERTQRISSHSVHTIAQNPINAPHKLLQAGLQHLGNDGAFWMRLVSVLFALVFIAFTYILLRYWFGNFIGFIGTLLFISTPILIVLARSATADIMYFAPISIISAYIWLGRAKKHVNRAWFILVIATALSLYTPGVLWFVLIASIIGSKALLHITKRPSGFSLTAGLVLFFVLLSPLLLGLMRQPHLIDDWLLVNTAGQSALDILKKIGWAFLFVFWEAPKHIDYIVGRLPLLDAMQVLTALIGVYAMWTKARRALYILASLILISITFAAINNRFILVVLCLPALAIFSTAGLRYLYIKWGYVFPRNPLARGLAVLLISLLALFQLAYGVRYALNAWPHTPDTQSIYMLK